MKVIKRICEMEAILDKDNYLMDIKSDELEDFRPEQMCLSPLQND